MRTRIAIFLIAACYNFQVIAQIQHIEPLNWWVGMTNPELQLLVNGNEIGTMVPQLSYPGVTIKRYAKGDSKTIFLLI